MEDDFEANSCAPRLGGGKKGEPGDGKGEVEREVSTGNARRGSSGLNQVEWLRTLHAEDRQLVQMVKVKMGDKVKVPWARMWLKWKGPRADRVRRRWPNEWKTYLPKSPGQLQMPFNDYFCSCGHSSGRSRWKEAVLVVVMDEWKVENGW